MEMLAKESSLSAPRLEVLLQAEPSDLRELPELLTTLSADLDTNFLSLARADWGLASQGLGVAAVFSLTKFLANLGLWK